MRIATQLLCRVIRHGAASSMGAVEGAMSCSSALRPSLMAAGQFEARHLFTTEAKGEGGGEGEPSKSQQPAPAAQHRPPQQHRPLQQPQQKAQQQQQQRQPPPKQKHPQQPPQQAATPQSKPQAAPEQPPREPEPDRLWHSGKDVAQLATVLPNKYFDVPKNQCPEATKQFYEDQALAEERVNQPNYGCKAVQVEAEWFAGASGSGGATPLLQRRCIADLVASAAGRCRGHTYLDGWAGSGKSVALFSLVNWARRNGWLVMYVPSAFMLVEGGTFHKGEDGLWDTPDAARLVLTAASDNHGSMLKKLHDSNGQPLSKLVAEGLAAKAPRDVVEAAIRLKEELQGLKEVPVLIAVDDYNVLYSHTGYQEAMHAFHRRDIAPDELRLARAFRVLEQPAPAKGMAVAAPTFGQTVSEKLRLPLPRGCRLNVPRYSLEEAAATAAYFQAVGHIEGQPDEDTLRRALFLTNGNAKELREYAPTLLHEDDPLGISLGYKAKAARLKEYMETVV